MASLSPLTLLMISTILTVSIIVIVYITGKRSNEKIAELLKTQILIAFKDVISEFHEEQHDAATWTLIGTGRSNLPMQSFNIVITLIRKHMILSLITSKIWGASQLLVIEGDFKRRSRIKLEILHQREKQVREKYRGYFRVLETIPVTNTKLSQSFLLKSNNLIQTNALFRFNDLENALLACDSFLYWASIETESPNLRIAFRLNSFFKTTTAAKLTVTLIRRYDQVLRKTEIRRT